MSQATPRKFSEKIAILERKQNEEQEQFNSVMRDVRTITSTDQPQQQPTPQPSPVQQHYGAPPSNDSSCGSKLSPEGPHPLTANWNRAGGSLPNVHQMVQQPMGSSSSGGAAYGGGWSPSWTNMPAATSAAGGGQGQPIQQQHVRTRSPGAPHFHPYRNGGGGGPMPPGGAGGRHDQQRMSQGETTSRGASIVHLQPPDPTWSKARSDPAIHTASMMTQMDPSGFMSAYPLYPGGGGQNPGLGGQWPSPDAKMFNGPATAPTSAAIMPPTMPMAFFPTYPLGLTQQPPPHQQQPQLLQMSQSPATMPPPNNQQQSTAQQMFTPPQQLGSPSSSSTVNQQQQFMGNNNNEMAGMGAAGGAMNLHNSNQQGRQNAGMVGAAANFSNFQPQQMMPNCMQNNTAGGVICRTAYQSGPQQHFANAAATGGGGYHHPIVPPMYPTGPGGMMKMSSAANALMQQQTMMMNAANNVGNNNGILQHNGGNILLHQQQLATPSMLIMGQSQSAPTSPSSTSATVQQCSSQMDGNQQQHPLAMAVTRQQQWAAQPPNRHFSASPDGMEVPNICVTGTDGSLDVDCFQDLQDLHLDSETLQMLKDPAANEQVDPACETQLLS